MPLIDNGEISIEKLNNIIYEYHKSKYALYFFFESLRQVLQENNTTQIIYEKINIANELKCEKIILVNMVAEEYYGLCGDRTNHIITLIPENDSCIAVDPYEKMGYIEFSDWDRCLENAKQYDWMQYDNFAVLL